MKTFKTYFLTFALFSSTFIYALEDQSWWETVVTIENEQEASIPTTASANTISPTKLTHFKKPRLSESIKQITNNAKSKADPRAALEELEALKEIKIRSATTLKINLLLIFLSAKFELLKENYKNSACVKKIADNINADLDHYIAAIPQIKSRWLTSDAKQRITNAFKEIKTVFNDKIKNLK